MATFHVFMEIIVHMKLVLNSSQTKAEYHNRKIKILPRKWLRLVKCHLTEMTISPGPNKLGISTGTLVLTYVLGTWSVELP